jgi:hypothetical protein
MPERDGGDSYFSFWSRSINSHELILQGRLTDLYGQIKIFKICENFDPIINLTLS